MKMNQISQISIYKKKIELYKKYICNYNTTQQYTVLTMAFEKRFKNDFVLVENFKSFINALFDENDKPHTLLNQTATKTQFLQLFAGEEYKSFTDFEHTLKISKRRSDKKTKVQDFLTTNNLEIYPHSAYAIFINDQKKTYEEKHSGLTANDIRKLMTKEWNEMSEKGKEKYVSLFKTKKQEFIDKVKNIDDSFIIYFDKSLAPKTALRPYNVFVQQNMKKIRDSNPSLALPEIMKKIGEQWKTMSEDAKKKFYAECGAEMPATKTKSEDIKKTTITDTAKATPKAKGKSKVVSDTEESDVEKPAPKSKAKGKFNIVSDTEESDVEKVAPKPKAKGKGKAISDTEESDVEKPKPKATKKPGHKKIDEILDD